MSGEAMNYRFGQKTHWRRFMWNAIEERLSVPAKDAVVLYLGGPLDLDRQIALSKGFRADNLIFIDKGEHVVQSQRREGKLAVCADFVQAQYSLPASMKAHVIFGDFCRGLSPDFVDSLQHAQFARNLENTVFAWNFLRGRDPQWNAWRSRLRFDVPTLRLDESDRALQFFTAMNISFLGNLNKYFSVREDGIQWVGEEAISEEQLKVEVMAWLGMLRAVFDPKFFSYRSAARQTFDSIVYRGIGGAIPQRVKVAWKDTLEGKFSSDTTKASLTATSAHRTMRSNRTGPYKKNRRAASCS